MTMCNDNNSQQNKNPYVTIIIPAYNAEQTVERCLLSVLGQSYCDWECIVIDDGSTDKTGDVIKRFSDKDKRIKVFVQTNSGVSAARNNGVNLAAGEWITFLDADDYLESDYLEKLVTLQMQHQTDLTMCEFTNFSPDEDKRDRREILNKDLYAEGEEAFKTFFPIFLWNGKKQRPGGPVCKLYKKKIIQENNIIFNKDVHYNEDFLFNLWYFQFVSSFYYLHESLYNRLLHEASAVHRYQNDIYSEVEKLFADYRQLRDKYKWKCDAERMFFLHLLTDLPFNMYICRLENHMRYRDKKKEYVAFICNPVIHDEYEKITFKDCIDLKSKVKFLLLKTKQFYLLKILYSKK